MRATSKLLMATTVNTVAAPAMADATDKRLALSNNYAGNSWRQAMLESWEKVTSRAVADGLMAGEERLATPCDQGAKGGGAAHPRGQP